ncbi:hypothetical protein RvY_01859 [Ramazzottius varieornatus]|uniref:Uncharacterized protein n=1 Tax=Ramazzottius varieornatus TaxID=947166 RepID=A0A1D1USF6_RAMVA|nr:hypothetical protein RvY_01859 [Ramazzottius varieornatus]
MDIDSEVECVSDGEHEEDDQREREEVRPSGCVPVYSGSLDFPSWEFFPAYCGVLGAFPFTELDLLKLLPCLLEGRAANHLNAQSEIMPFIFVGLFEVPAVKPGVGNVCRSAWTGTTWSDGCSISSNLRIGWIWGLSWT